MNKSLPKCKLNLLWCDAGSQGASGKGSGWLGKPDLPGVLVFSGVGFFFFGVWLTVFWVSVGQHHGRGIS